MIKRRSLLAGTGLMMLAGLLMPDTASAADKRDAMLLVDKATTSARAILTDPNYSAARSYLDRAKGVMIVPGLVKAGFIVGGEVGDAVVLARSPDGSWSDPSFHFMAAGSIGFQIGVEAKEIVIAIMTDKGLNALMTDQFKFGGDVSVTAGPVGAGVSAGTVGSAGADFVAFSKSKGLFGGGALDGSLIQPKPDYLEAFYGTAASPKQVLIERKFSTADADGLKKALRDR